MMRIGIAADHEGFALKEQLAIALNAKGYVLVDFGAHELTLGDDYPDFAVSFVSAVIERQVERGLAIYGSGVGVWITVIKIHHVRHLLVGLLHWR